jgi:hypothetical protein
MKLMFYCLEACLGPYIDLLNLQALHSHPLVLNPKG